MTVESLGVAAGIVLSLVFGYIPGAKDWFENLKEDEKQTAMGIFVVLVSFAIFGLSCANVIVGQAECTQQGFYEFLKIVFWALAGNVTTYNATSYIGKMKKE